MSGPTRHVVAAVDEIPPGGRKLVEVAGRRVVVFNLGGEFFALGDRCPHQGGSLAAGCITGHVSSPEPGRYSYSRRGEMIRCPWHYWEFDIRTGRSRFDPGRVKTRRYEARVESGAALRDAAASGEGALRAETFAVRVENDYIVVDA